MRDSIRNPGRQEKIHGSSPLHFRAFRDFRGSDFPSLRSHRIPWRRRMPSWRRLSKRQAQFQESGVRSQESGVKNLTSTTCSTIASRRRRIVNQSAFLLFSKLASLISCLAPQNSRLPALRTIAPIAILAPKIPVTSERTSIENCTFPALLS